ncbi:phosphotransferase [Sphingomonas jatrophae]|uniref:Predicted kinase, aminoglycoside phosphotransferase (APT) family n=1 Tax=Sphingomonas jatrophae TaxID=1166337 RepID=A0A1I6KES4_9SPHN|nr:phosphotransferase [Sphingomonas jatrophae]SFR89741.1 Predicted kinase, aminoglycoside phosphotransferase (APT) family [Sphingomonas jatrophae]
MLHSDDTPIPAADARWFGGQTAEAAAALRGWIEAIGGAPVRSVQRIAGGAFRTSARLTLAGGRTLFVKVDLGTAPRTPFDLERESRVLAALAGRGRAPRLLGYDPAGQAMVLTCLPGSADFAGIADPQQRARIEASFVEALAETHRIDLAGLALDHLPAGRSIGQAIAADLALWRDLLVERVADPDPVALFALAWCAARVPADARPAVLVQGDAGPGNFLFDASGVTGLVDWEMAHVGHPLEDLGCVLARSLVQPMAPADRLLVLYNAASGLAWTKAELRYATILVMTRFSVPINLALAAGDPGLDLVLTDSYFRLSQLSLLRVIAEAEGIALDETVPERGARPALGFAFDHLRALLATVVRPAIGDDYARYRLDGAVGLLGYLGAALAEDTATPPEPATKRLADATATIAAGGETLHATLQTLFTGALWREHLMRDMLGPLHGRRVAI